MKRVLFAIMMIMAVGEVWADGENISYVLETTKDQEYTITTHVWSFTGEASDVFNLKGPGAKLYFEAKKNGANHFYVQTSTSGSGNSWSDLGGEISLGNDYPSTPYSIDIPANVKRIRFYAKTGATLNKWIRNIKVTRATSLTTTTTSTITFGNVSRNTESTAKNAVVHYENTTYNQHVTGTCPDGAFVVTSTEVGATSYSGTWTGSDYKSSTGKNVPIKFCPTSTTALGTHNATVTLNMNGQSVTVNVSAVCQTTYYAQSAATAVPTAGGTAYTSFSSYASATSSNATTNYGPTTNSSATNNIYYKAAENANYVFKGWTATGVDYSAGYIRTAKETTYKDFTYNSENSESPTTASFQAWFAPLYYFTATASVNDADMGTASVVSCPASVEGTPGTGATNQTVTAKAKFTATPKEGYKFVRWENEAGVEVSRVAENYEAEISNTGIAGHSASLALKAVFEPKSLMLSPTSPDYEPGLYKGSITLSRTLRAGYNSLALPFTTDVQTLTGRTNAGDWVAQLETVTYNAQDGYTLYFQKGDGSIAANQPYVLHLADGAANITNPTFSGQAVSAPSAQTVTPSSGYDGQDDINSSYEDWTMRSNFTKGFSMAGKYGIVNSAGGLMLGGEGSTLNAFSAYIQPPTGAAGIRVQSAYIDWDGTIDYVPGLPGEASDFEDSAVYDLSGRRISHPVRGLNIIRRPDGTVRKVMAR